MGWNELSMKDRADVMKLFIDKGIYDLDTIQGEYNRFAEGGDTVREWVDAIYQNNPKEDFLGEPEHHYDFTQSEEWANAHGYYPDARGHRDDRVKKPAHPSHPSRGTWNGDKFILTDIGMENPNYTLFGLNDGGQDPQAILTYNGGSVIPEIIVTPNGNYIYNPYDNIKLKFAEGGGIHIDPSKRGTFTAAASRHNMGVQEFASKVLANKDNYSAAMVKKANFARNASKWHGFGGNIFDGNTEPTQQMQQGYIRQRPEGTYFYDVEGQPEIDVTPLNASLSSNPADWSFTDASGKIYSPHRDAIQGTGELRKGSQEGPILSAVNNYLRELNWRAKNDPASIALQGKYTMPAIAATALLPWLGEAAAATNVAGVPLTTWADAGLTAGFGAHGLNHAINEGINSWGDAAMTALEVAPLGRLAKPIFNEAALAIENYRYPLGRPQIPENFLTVKPQVRTRVGDVEIDNPELYYHQADAGKAENFVSTGRMRTPLEEYWLAKEEAGEHIPTRLRAGIEPGYPQDPGSAMFAQGNLWYGLTPNKPDLLVTAREMPIANKNASIMSDKASLRALEAQGTRRVTNDNIYTQGPHNRQNTAAYTWEPGYGYRRILAEETPVAEWSMGRTTPQITAENAASMAPKVNWDADNWFKTISGRSSYSAEEAAELASHVPEYRAIEQRLFDEGRLAVDSNGNIVVVGSEMSPQEYIMRQSEAFQKMNPEHHYVGVSKKLRDTFENEARDPATRNRYDVWTDRKSPKNVEEYAISQQGGHTNTSQIEKIENQMSIREENHELHKEQLKWKLEHGKISQETYDRDLAALEDNYSIKQKEDGEELKVLKQQEALDPLNGGKVFDVTYPLNTAEAPVVDAEGNHWHSIPYLTVQRDAPVLTSHYQPYDPVNTTVQTDQLVTASRRHGYGVTHIDNVKDTYDGTMLDETIIGRGTPVKSVLGNTGTFDIESPNKWRLYRSLFPPFLGLGTFGALYGEQE